MGFLFMINGRRMVSMLMSSKWSMIWLKSVRDSKMFLSRTLQGSFCSSLNYERICQLLFKGRIDRRERKWNSSGIFFSAKSSSIVSSILIRNWWEEEKKTTCSFDTCYDWKYYQFHNIDSSVLYWIRNFSIWNSTLQSWFIIKLWCSYQNMVSVFSRVNPTHRQYCYSS